MKKPPLFFWLLLTVLAFAPETYAQSYKTGLGVRLSSSNAVQNNSISLKQFLTDQSALEVLFTFGDPLAIGAVYQKHTPLSVQGMRWFYGAGGYLAFVKTYNPSTGKQTTDPNVGAQGVVGLDYKFPGIPLNLSLDWKPELNMVDQIQFEPGAVGLTARFTFGN